MKARGNQVVMPLNVAKMIEKSDQVFKMAEILDGLDYRKLRSTYRRHWRSVAPEIMFSIIVFANEHTLAGLTCGKLTGLTVLLKACAELQPIDPCA